MKQILIKRIYEDIDKNDGFRILVDRLWPRGISKEKAALDLWSKEVTPSNELRKAVHSGELSWQEFDEKYKLELSENPEFKIWVDTVIMQLEKTNVTLITSAKLNPQGHPYILKKAVEDKIAG